MRLPDLHPARIFAAFITGVALVAAMVVGLGAAPHRSGPPERERSQPVERQATVTGDRADVFRGAGAWIDRYDQPLWNDPGPVLDVMRRRGVRTLFLQTSMSAERYAVKEPARTDQILQLAHARGIKVVAWYLPYARRRANSLRIAGRRVRHVNKRTDLARSLRAIDYVSADGRHRFDGFALDIEPSTGSDHAVKARERMLVDFSRQLRRHAGPAYPLAAIVPPPVFSTDNPRTSWKRFPWRGIAPYYDAWMPMLFFKQWQHARVRVDRGFGRDVTHIRTAMAGGPQLPIHIVAEVAADAGVREHRHLIRAVRRTGVAGASIYDAASSDAADWKAVQRLATWFARTGRVRQ